MLARFEQPVKVCCGTSVISDQVVLQKRCEPDVVIQHSASTIKGAIKMLPWDIGKHGGKHNKRYVNYSKQGNSFTPPAPEADVKARWAKHLLGTNERPL
jgi:hypothetical protein